MCLLARTIVNAFRLLFIFCILFCFLPSVVSYFSLSGSAANNNTNSLSRRVRIYTHLLRQPYAKKKNRLIFLLVCGGIQFVCFIVQCSVGESQLFVWPSLDFSSRAHTDTYTLYCRMSFAAETVIIYGVDVEHGARVHRTIRTLPL